jgi:RNA polymerase sigma-70 factor (ECF subfamily)
MPTFNSPPNDVLELPHAIGFEDAFADRREERLIERLRSGEPAAVAELYDRYRNDIRAFARRLVGDPTIAEDLVHETFVSIPAAMASYRAEAALRTFVFGIAVNHAKHHVRAAARRRKAIAAYASEAKGSPTTPDQASERRELVVALHRALDELPIDQRVAFVLCEIEERSSKDVAEFVGVPESTVRTRLLHARKKLRELLTRRGVSR